VLGANDQGSVVTSGPWTARDGFIADTAIRLDRLQAKLERLELQNEGLRRQVAGVVEEGQQANRFQAFEESLRNAREYKIDEVLRQVKELKVRLDEIEGPRSAFGGLTYKTFEAIDQKLTELHSFQVRMRVLERSVRVNAVLFCASLGVLGWALAARFGFM